MSKRPPKQPVPSAEAVAILKDHMRILAMDYSPDTFDGKVLPPLTQKVRHELLPTLNEVLLFLDDIGCSKKQRAPLQYLLDFLQQLDDGRRHELLDVAASRGAQRTPAWNREIRAQIATLTEVIDQFEDAPEKRVYAALKEEIDAIKSKSFKTPSKKPRPPECVVLDWIEDFQGARKRQPDEDKTSIQHLALRSKEKEKYKFFLGQARDEYRAMDIKQRERWFSEEVRDIRAAVRYRLSK